MGTLVGHVAPGMGFFLIGLWHLFNHTRLYAAGPRSYRSRAWFSAGGMFRYAELAAIAGGACYSIAMELFIGPERHHPLDPDGSIPSNHLHNFEHASISAAFLAYAVLAAAMDQLRVPDGEELAHVAASAAFAQQLFLFHTHSADHSGVEGQYHLLLQLVVAVSLFTALLGVFLPADFHVSFVRSASILFQGAWLVLMGLALWTPRFVPKGCFMNSEEGHQVVHCRDHPSLHRARSLVNIQFSWALILITLFSFSLHLLVVKHHARQTTSYQALSDQRKETRFRGDEDGDDVESGSVRKYDDSSFIHIGTRQVLRAY